MGTPSAATAASLSPARPASATELLRGFPVLVVSASACFAGMWMAAPVLALLLVERGASPGLIGAITALGWLAALAVTPATPMLAARLGGVLTLHRWSVCVGAASLVLHLVWDDLGFWTALVVLRGAASALAWTTADVLAATHAPKGREGQALGIYQTFVSASVGAGPLLAAGVGADSEASFLVAALVLLAGLALGFRLPRERAALPRRCGCAARGASWRLIALIGVALGAAALSGLFEAVAGAMLPAHALEAMAFDPTDAALVAAVAGLGNLLAQYPLGWLADRIAPWRITLGAAVIVGVAAASWPLLAPGFAHWVALAWLGGAAGMFYSLGMIAIAKRLRGPVRAAALAWLNAGYLLGGVVGPPATGLVADLVPGALGLPLFLGAAGLLAGLVLAWGLGLRARARLSPEPVAGARAAA